MQFDKQMLQEWVDKLVAWLQNSVLTADSLIQAIIIGVAFCIALALSNRTVKWMRRHEQDSGATRRATAIFDDLMLSIYWLALQWLAILIVSSLGQPVGVQKIVASLLTAWLIIHLASSLAGETLWTRLLAWTAWTIAALNIVNLLGPTVAALDSTAITLGDLRVSPYLVLKAVLALAFLLWGATILGNQVDNRVKASALSPSLKVLISKLSRIGLIVAALLISVQAVGLDLSVLAFFGGAVGLGIGFGLQKIIGNLVSGVILLVDKSIKPGDVVAVGGTYGWVKTLGGRYVSVITRDGVEHLIPNETLITERVENWTHSDRNVRLKIPIGVHYNADLHQAIELCIEAAAEHSRVLQRPPPRCLLKGFGDNAVDLEIRLWINDANEGVSNLKSAVMLSVWDKFQANDIEIPYPQRDLHLKNPDLLKSILTPEAETVAT